MIIPVGFAQANFRFGGPAAPLGAEMTIGLDVALWGGGPTALATALVADWNTANIDAVMTNKIGMTQCEVKYGPNATGPSGFWNGSLNGTINAEAVAPNTSVLISKLTAFGGRSGKGRFYLPGFSEGSVNSSGQVDAAGVLATTNAFEAWRGLVEARDVGFVLLHNPGAPLTIPTPVTAFACQTQVATQRRRNRK